MKVLAVIMQSAPTMGSRAYYFVPSKGVFFGIVLLELCIVGCNSSEQSGAADLLPTLIEHVPFEFEEQIQRDETEFRVDWPPSEPGDSRVTRFPPLLTGTVIATTGAHSGPMHVHVRIELNRDDSEENRKRWNQNLKFPEYEWMSQVRTWDHQRKWLWPNLPYLLSAHGIEREHRYGGVDPGKGVDNDFAAVVLKPLNSNQKAEPVVTADWHASIGGFMDKHTIIHNAISGDLLWTVPQAESDGLLGIWLVYGDFLDFSPPESWPTEPEYDGGILSYFFLSWEKSSAGLIEVHLSESAIPPEATGVDWPRWLELNQRFR